MRCPICVWSNPNEGSLGRSARGFSEEGKRESITEGIAQANADNARKMLEKGMDKALIADITGLSPEEIDALA